MPEIILINRSGEERPLKADTGVSLMHALTSAGAGDLLALCGGVMACATCHVYIDEAFAPLLTETGEDESEMLSCMPHRKSVSRLACQILLKEELSGMRVTIAPED